MEESHYEMKVGEVREIQLKGLASAGFAWSFEIAGDATAIDVDHDYVGEKPSPPVTYSLDDRFTIRALKPAVLTIRFKQQRSWEVDQPPRAEQSILINIVA